MVSEENTTIIAPINVPGNDKLDGLKWVTELEQYNLWRDYLDAQELVDAAMASISLIQLKVQAR
nr:hypothetical protein [Escherichia coli]